MKKSLRLLDVFLVSILAIVVVGMLFELYGHYAYIHTKGNTIVRVDRVTGDTCTMPCNGSEAESFIAPAPKETPTAKTCHIANVVRVTARMRVPVDRKRVAYGAGGFDDTSIVARNWRRHIVPYASELSDGHIYSFSRDSYQTVATWSTGQDVEVCATWSKIENRPYFSIGTGDDTEPASIAI